MLKKKVYQRLNQMSLLRVRLEAQIKKVRKETVDYLIGRE